MAKRKRDKKRKVVNYEIIPVDTTMSLERSIYRMVRAVMKECWQDLVDAKCRVGLAWRSNWKSDANGRVRYGQTVILNEWQRSAANMDVLLVLNRDLWKSADFTDAMKEAAIDERLASVQVAKESDGSFKFDQMDRCLLRKRQADVVSHTDVIKRRGAWHEGLQEIAQALEDSGHPLFEQPSRLVEEKLPPPVKPVARAVKTQA